MPRATWSPLPMPYSPMGGDPGREGTGLGAAYTAVALTTPGSTWTAFSETWGDTSTGGHVKLRLRFFLEYLRITYDLFDSPHPPTALVVLLDLDADDVRLRRANPYCSVPGPKDITLFLMLPTWDSAREFMLSFSKNSDADQTARTTKAEAENAAVNFRGVPKDMPLGLKLRMMQILAEKPLATMAEVLEVPTTLDAADNIMQDPDSANPLAAMRPEQTPGVLPHVEIGVGNEVTFAPECDYREANGIVVLRSAAEVVNFFGNLDSPDHCDPRHALWKTPLWLQPSANLVAKHIAPLAVSNPGLKSLLSSMDRDQWQTLIEGNLRDTATDRPGHTAPDPFYVDNHAVDDKMDPRGGPSSLGKRIADQFYPGMASHADANGAALALIAGDAPAEFRFWANTYENGVKTFMGNARIGDDETAGGSSVPPPINQALWAHTDRETLIAADDGLRADIASFFRFERGPESEPQRTPLHAFLRRLSGVARRYLGLTSTQVPVFVLAITHVYGCLMNDKPSLLNLLIVGPPGTGKSFVIAMILDALGLPAEMGGRESATAPGYGGLLHDLCAVGRDEADWILAIANGTLNPVWEAMKKTLMEAGGAIQQITVTQKNGPPKQETIRRLCRSVTFTAANFVPGVDANSGDSEGGIRGGGALTDRCTIVKIPKQSLVDRAEGGSELAAKTTADKMPAQKKMVLSALQWLGGIAGRAHLFSHLVSPSPEPDLLALNLFIKAMAGHVNMGQRQLQRVGQQALALCHTEVTTASLAHNGWLDENDKPYTLEPFELALVCRHLIPSAAHVVMSSMMVQIDIAERQWTDIAIEYITSGVGFKTKPVDPAAPDGAVEIMRAPTGDHIVLTSSGWKDLASSISQYLNATPNAVTPGVSVIEKWLKSYGELPDRLAQSKLVEMSYEIPIGKLTRPVTCIAVSRPWASEILSTTDINVCSVAQDLWNKGGNLVLADGRWVIPYSPVGEDTSNADFAAHIASLDKNDAIVLDPDMVYRIEELTATDATTTDYVKKAKEIIAGRNQVRLGKTSLQKNFDALVGVKRAKFRGEHYSALAFMTATQVLALKPLPADNPTRPSNAVVHPTEQGRYCTTKTLASAVIINPAFVKKATEMQGATRQALDSKMAEALDGYCQAMGPGDATYLKKKAASDVGWPIAVSPTKDQAFIEIPVRDPAESRGIVTQDPYYGRGGHDPDVWVPKNAAKEDKTKTCLDEYYTGDKPTATIPPGANLGAKQYRDLWGSRIDRGQPHRKLVPPWIRHWLPPDDEAPPDDGDSAGQLVYGSDSSNSEEYGDWSQPQSQAGSGAAAKRPGEADAGAGWKRQRQEE